ncbi:putative ABC transport system permease protein [Tahibacter aquaticus]|uniref:Putative ABC transport system permease protein n=1 Tax=Tahibacter aquaticus TaxID=520092 RepID=A0A4R6ZAB7_9GAMM|nr:ABC transporter permease [Tahibacter aquaticus]TDR48887.1 putative ABC transport system permease protein [Tahibacter aquaticus]
MTKTGFVLANLFRKKTRTILTLLSVIMAFLLFGLLQAVNVVFNAGADFVGATRLVTQARVSFTQSLPLRILPELEAVPGVDKVMYQQWFGGVIGENTQIFAFAVEPARIHAVYPEYIMPDAQWKAFADTRTGAIVGRLLANQYGWKVGDKLPLNSNIFPKKDGSKTWGFDIVGIFDGKDEQWQNQTNQVLINFDYFNEANQFGSGAAGIYVLKLANSDAAQQVADTIDAKYENSPDETKTQTEKDWSLGFVKQIGDIGLMVRWILFAVFFTLLLVVGNTMAQSMRERVPELAVLKTLGFSDGSVLGFVLAESIALCALGGLIGLSIATGLGIVIKKFAGAVMPLTVSGPVWVAGLIAIIVLSLAVGLLPALRAQRLKIVDALAGR